MEKLTILLLFPVFLHAQDSLYLSTEKPLSTWEDIPTTLGMEFKPSSPGNITALKFYKVDATAGSYTLTLWAMDGSKPFQSTVNVSGIGWKRIPCNIPVNQDQPYIVSAYSTLNRYGYTNNLFSLPRIRGQLYAYSGRYIRSAGFPASNSTTWYGLDVVFEKQIRNPLIVNAGKDTAASWPCDSIRVNGIATGDGIQYVWSIDNQWGDVSVTGTSTLNPVVKFKEPDSGAILILTATDKWGTTSEHGVSVSVMPDFEPYVKRMGELIMNQLRFEMIRKWKAGE